MFQPEDKASETTEPEDVEVIAHSGDEEDLPACTFNKSNDL